jgi:small-conductance mechanosensitive channel
MLLATGPHGAAGAMLALAAQSPAPSPTATPGAAASSGPFQAVLPYLTNRVLPAILFLLAFLVLARLVRRITDRWVRGRLDIEVALLVSRAIYLGLVGVGMFAAGATLLVDANAAVWGVLAAALLAGLGFQDLFKNYVSGFYVLLERNIRVGDVVQTSGGFSGVVTDVKMRVTYLRDDGRLIIVPNSTLFNDVTVVSAPHGHKPAADRPAEAGSGGEGAQDDARQRGEVGPGKV